MSRSEAQRLVKRLVADTGFLVRLAQVEDDEELDRLIRAEGFDCTWEETLALYHIGSSDAEQSEEFPKAS